MSIFLERQEIQERRTWGSVFKRMERISLSLMIVFAGLGLLYALYRLVFLGSYFRVDDIVLRGHWSKLDAPQLIELSGVRQGRNLFLLNVEHVHERIMSNDWVKEVAVRRHLPNTLLIAVEEYEPKAILLKHGSMNYVAPDGTVFKRLEAHDDRAYPFITGLNRYADRIGGSGDDGAEGVVRALDIMDAFGKTGIGKAYGVAEVHFDPVRGFSVITAKRPLEVLLGMNHIHGRIARLDRFENFIRERGGRIQYILANEPGRVVVQYRRNEI